MINFFLQKLEALPDLNYIKDVIDLKQINRHNINIV